MEMLIEIWDSRQQKLQKHHKKQIKKKFGGVTVIGESRLYFIRATINVQYYRFCLVVSQVFSISMQSFLVCYFH